MLIAPGTWPAANSSGLGHDAMQIGVDAFRSPEDLRLDHLLIQPFQDTPGQYPINRRRAAYSSGQNTTRAVAG